MVEKPKKKGIAIIISVGGKPPKGPADTSTPDMKKYGADPMKKSWNFLKYGGPAGMDGLDDDGNYPQGKTEPINMQEYPAGSGRFMSLKDMMEARNADARKNIQRMDNNMGGRRGPNVGGQPETNAIAGNKQRNNIMVSPTGNLSDIPEDQRWNPL
tara:strand:+ start:2027 stop:2494 length:468 start_codon:yes stop_codon:yes gene_type:complete